jgi:esterase/lipase
MPNPIDSSRTWSIEKVRKEFTSDRREEMCLSAGGQKLCLGTALALITALEDVRKDVIPGLNIPFFVCHGTNDYGVPISGSEYLIEHSVTEEKDMGVNFVQDEYHDLLSEKSRKEVVISMIDWMNSRIEK